MRTRKKEKNREKLGKTRFAKGTKREKKREDNKKIRTERGENSEKKREERKTNKKWYIRKIMKRRKTIKR